MENEYRDVTKISVESGKLADGIKGRKTPLPLENPLILQKRIQLGRKLTLLCSWCPGEGNPGEMG